MLSLLRTIILLYLLTLSFISVSALPLRTRQNANSTTIQTVKTTQTLAGPMIETCTITLSPTTDNNGVPSVIEVKQCVATISLPPCASGTTTGCGTTSSVSSTVTATLPASPSGASSSPAATTVPGNNGSSSLTATSAASSTSPSSDSSPSPSPSPSPTSSPSAIPDVVVNGVSTVTGAQPSTSPSGAQPTSTNSKNTSPGTAALDTTAAAAAAASGTSAAFQLPGKKLSVLPIGLGIFAGISVIALIVVGLVTYERTKYRKAFRQRKLEESGSAVGYIQR